MNPTRLAVATLLTGAFVSLAVAQTPPAAPTPAPAAPAPAVPPSPPPIIPLDDAILRAANDLFSKAIMPEGSDRMQLVIDPLIDGVTGAQSRATQSMEKRITDLVRSSYPRFEPQPLPRTR